VRDTGNELVLVSIAKLGKSPQHSGIRAVRAQGLGHSGLRG